MKFKWIFILALLMSSVTTLLAQEKVVGKVTDENGQPMPGVSVVVKGKPMGTLTDAKGQFVIKANLTDTLKLSFIGYATQQVGVTSNNLEINWRNMSPLELTEAAFNKASTDRLKSLKQIPAYAKNATKLFSSDPTNTPSNAAGLIVINKLIVTPEDSDGDGLSDADELLIGTDPHNPDTDGDGLLDGWEVGVVNGINLKQLGASPLHKDIFVQMDYMTRPSAKYGLGPNPAVIAGIEKAFANAPVDNPDGVRGINIHLIIGQEIPYQADLNPLIPTFTALKQKYFDSNKGAVFHYMIWANGYEDDSSSGNAMTIGGSDFVVTLGLWNDGNGGTDEEKIGTFIHELGHNLGLRHGDTEDINYKPNHLSIMNYAYQVTGINYKGSNYFTYQSFDLPSLDENNLSEKLGINASNVLAGYKIQMLSADGTLTDAITADGPIDWNQNGQIEAGMMRADINQDTQFSILLATPNEWGRLLYKCGSIGQLTPVAGLVQRLAKKYNATPMNELSEQRLKSHYK